LAPARERIVAAGPESRPENAKGPDASARSPREYASVEGGLRQVVGDVAEGVAELAAEQREDRGYGDGHQGGDQALLDGGGAGLVLHEARNELGHLRTPSIDGQAAGGFSDTACSPKRRSNFADRA
jgi:hypothetical protein